MVIGGISSTITNDNQGPEIKASLNDDRFVNGGITNAAPVLLVGLSMPVWANWKHDFPNAQRALRVKVIGEQFALAHSECKGLLKATDALLLLQSTNVRLVRDQLGLLPVCRAGTGRLDLKVFAHGLSSLQG